MYIYNARTTGYLNISHLLIYIKSIKNIEKKLCENDTKRKKKFDKKWKNVLKKLIKKKKGMQNYQETNAYQNLP